MKLQQQKRKTGKQILRWLSSLFITLCIISFGGFLWASNASKSGIVDIDTSRVSAIFQKYENIKSPGVVVMVIQKGKIQFAKGYGYTDLDFKQKLTSSTPFRLASVSKQFTAMAIMILAERDMLNYDDPVVRWIPELKRIGKKITIRHLLNHTSGLPRNFVGLAQPDINIPLDNEAAISTYENKWELLFTPGERFSYSNLGYAVLGLIIERISGQTYGQFLTNNIFKPLRIKNAVVRDRPEIVVPGRAIGYKQASYLKKGWFINDNHYLNWLVGGKGVYASLNDLYLWDQALYTDRLVSQKTIKEAFTPAILNDGSTSEYGFGWMVSDQFGKRSVRHSGSWVGFRTSISRYIEERLTIIVMSNASANVKVMNNEVAKVLLSTNENE